MIVMLAGLQSIDESLYEAAIIDGASYWQTILKITMPLLRPIFFYCFLMAAIFSFRLFAEPYVITGGGPGDVTMTISLYMYKSGFEHLKLGYASATSYMLLMIIISVSSMLLLFFKRELK